MIKTEVSLLKLTEKEVFMNLIPESFYLVFQFLAYILDVIFFKCNFSCNFLIYLYILIKVVWSYDLCSDHPDKNA